MRDIKNYQTQTIPFTDPATQAAFPEAILTLGGVTIDVMNKSIAWDFAVWASKEAFENGGAALGTVKSYLLTESSGLDFDTVMERFPEMKSDVGKALMTISAELDAGMHNKTEIVEDTE